MSDTTQIGVSPQLQQRIAEARARQAEIDAQQRQTVDSAKMEHFIFLVDKLFGPEARATLQARVDWRGQPALIIPWEGAEQVLVALPKPTGHVGWTLGAVELFEQKYAPAPASAFDQLLVALSTSAAA